MTLSRRPAVWAMLLIMYDVSLVPPESCAGFIFGMAVISLISVNPPVTLAWDQVRRVERFPPDLVEPVVRHRVRRVPAHALVGRVREAIRGHESADATSALQRPDVVVHAGAALDGDVVLDAGDRDVVRQADEAPLEVGEEAGVVRL